MIKFTNGTRGFLGQISKKFLIEKELKNYANQISDNKLDYFFNSFNNGSQIEKRSTYMYNIYRSRIQNEELDLLYVYFKKRFHRNSIFEISSRCYIKNRLFHSLIYRRNEAGIDSYSVCFDRNKTEHFGKIVKFISINGGIFAIIQKYHIKKEFITELPSISNKYGLKKNLKAIQQLFSKNYFCFDKKYHILKLVPVHDIICNCLIVYSENDSFFTKLAYYFEHD